MMTAAPLSLSLSACLVHVRAKPESGLKAHKAGRHCRNVWSKLVTEKGFQQWRPNEASSTANTR
eukprot:6106296-Amphidinium_carterae.1